MTKASSKLKICFLVSLSVVLLSLVSFRMYQEYIESEKKAEAILNADINHAQTIAEYRKRFARFDMVHLFSEMNDVSTSWEKNELEILDKTLQDKKYDLIILPNQGVYADFDRVSRILSANALATAIKEKIGKTVMPAELVLRALGKNSWRFSDLGVTELALKTGADVLHLYTDVPSTTKYRERTANLAVVMTDAHGKISSHKQFDLGRLEENPYMENKINAVISDITNHFFEKSFEKFKKKNIQKNEVWRLPKSFSNISDAANTELDSVVHLQLLALLTPKYLEFERRRLFERSLDALNSLDSKSTHFNLLKSRALFHLYRRPLALEFLEMAESPEELAVKSYINGNFNALKESLMGIEDELLFALSYIEFSELSYAYDRGEDNSYLLAKFPMNWQFLLAAAGRDTDKWYSSKNIDFFTAIKGIHPEFDEHYMQTLRQLVVSGKMDDANIQSLFITKVFEPLRTSTSLVRRFEKSVELFDYWNLYRNIAVSNVLRKLNSQINNKALYSKAVNNAEILKPVLSGQRSFSRLYLQALFKSLMRQTEESKTLTLSKIAKLLVELLDNTGHIDESYLIAVNLNSELTNELRKISSDENVIKIFRIKHRLGYVNDFPSGNLKYDKGNMSPALKFTNTNFATLMSAYIRKELSKEEYEKELQERFDGHPHRYFYMAQILFKESGDPDEIIELLEKALDLGNNSWATYDLLAKTYSGKGDYVKAKETYLAFPGFKKTPKGQRVEVTNYAADAANDFYWRGRYKEAIPLFEIAASMGTGAGAEFSSQQRLGLIEKDFYRAVYYAFTRGKRYNSNFAYRDYLSILHLAGDHKNAEAGFRELAPRFKEPVVWTAEFIGQRIQDMSMQEITEWTSSYLTTVPSTLVKQAQRYLFLQSFIDREVTNEILNNLATIDYMEVSKKDTRTNSLLSKVFSEHIVQKACDSDIQGCDLLKSKKGIVTTKSKEKDSLISQTEEIVIPSREYIGFAEAYLLLKSGKNRKAFEAFMDYDGLYEMYYFNKFSLPYFAMSLDNKEVIGLLPELLKIIETDAKKHFSPDNFDHELTNAVIHAHLGNKDRAMQSLKVAFERRPHTKWRPIFSWYQLTETAVWISEKMEDSRYIEQALDWAKDYQVIQPQFAWAYAFEAKYSKNTNDRIRAAGFAFYLDPRSKWLSEVPEELVNKGKAWFINNNPFSLESVSKQGQSNTST